MRRRSGDILRPLALAAVVAVPGAVRGQLSAGSLVLSADELTAIHSVVGSATPFWAPDGSHIVFAGTYGVGSDLWAIRPTGGFPLSLDVQMGPISFLQSHQPSY